MFYLVKWGYRNIDILHDLPWNRRTKEILQAYLQTMLLLYDTNVPHALPQIIISITDTHIVEFITSLMIICDDYCYNSIFLLYQNYRELFIYIVLWKEINFQHWKKKKTTTLLKLIPSSSVPTYEHMTSFQIVIVSLVRFVFHNLWNVI